MARAVTYDDLLRFARTLRDSRLATIGGRAFFSLDVDLAEIVVTPESTGKARRVRRDVVERVIARFSESTSLSPRDYQDITHDSAYLLALIDLLVRARSPSLASPNQ